MGSIRNLSGAAPAVIAAIALAQSPYEIHGLHTDLVFTEAVAQAEKLGGNCQITASGTQDGGTSARCEYLPCIERNQAGTCEQQNPRSPGLTIAAQPVLQISLEAPTDSARLTRILLVFEGSDRAVADSLKQAFGPPDGAGTSSEETSWSHSHRLNWTQGHYRMGLLDSPKLIILATDQAQK
jgi:hypothetical protein